MVDDDGEGRGEIWGGDGEHGGDESDGVGEVVRAAEAGEEAIGFGEEVAHLVILTDFRSLKR